MYFLILSRQMLAQYVEVAKDYPY